MLNIRSAYNSLPLNLRAMRKKLAGNITLALMLSLLVVTTVTLQIVTRPVSSTPVASAVKARTAPAAAPGKGFFHAGHEMSVSYSGVGQQALQSGAARPLTLAAGDFDLDGAPDLVTGYATAAGGILTLQRGNKDAFAPNSSAVYKAIQKGVISSTFVESATTYLLPGAPDFVLAEDFNNDGVKDVLAASRDGGLYLLTGDGMGDLSAPVSIESAGRITGIAAGQFNRPDGLIDFAVTVVGAQGPMALVYQGVKDGLSKTPFSYSLPAEATFVGLESLDGDIFSDLAVAAGNQLVIIHGRKSGLGGPETPGQRETIDLPFRVESAVFGEFTWDRDNRPEIALVAEDGSSHLLERKDLDTRPFTEKEQAAFNKERNLGTPADAATLRKLEVEWQSRNAPEWVVAGLLDVNLPSTDGLKHSLLKQIRLPGATDGLLSLDGVREKIRISPTRQSQNKNENQLQASAIESQPLAELPLVGQPVAVAELPKKVNGDREILVLNSDSPVPNSVVISAATFPQVDRFDDPLLNPVASPQSAPEAQCTVAANDCSLRGAIIFANQAANIPATITVPAGTYNLTQITTGENNGRLGDLDVKGDGTVITGAGSGTTTIQWSAAVTNANRDRLLEINPNVVAGFDFQVSGITFTGGFLPTTGSGGAIIGGSSTSTSTFTNCVFTGNTANNNGGGISHSSDVSTHSVTLTGCTFTNNTASLGSGGGLNYLGAGDVTTHVGVTISAGTVFSGNTAVQGGAMTLGGSTGVQTFSLPKLGIVNNTATADGGGIMLNSGAMNLSFSRFLGNTSASCGDALCRAGGAVGTATATNNWWGCNTDPTNVAAAQADGCDAVAPGSGGTNPTVNPRLVLTISANPALLCRGATSTLTASFLLDSNNGAVLASNLDRLIGLPVTWNNAINGAISSPQTSIQANGTATATFTTGANHGAASADATVDNGTVTASLTVPDSFTSVQTGNFDAATTWTPQCVPQSDDSVTIANTHTVSLPASDSIADVTINAGGTLNTNAFNLDVNSSNNLKNYASVNTWSNSGSLSGLGTITFNGNGVRQKLNGTTTFNNLTINHTNANNVDATGSTLTVNQLMRVQAGTFISSSTYNNVQIDSGATLQGITATTMNVSGNWTNSGTFTPSGNTVVFNGSGSQTIGGNATTTFNVLTLSNTASPIIVNPAVTNQMNVSSTFTINANVTLSPAATAVIGGTGTMTGNGTALVSRIAATPDFLTQYPITNKTLTNLTVNYSGAGNQTVNNTPAYGPLTISGTGIKTLQGNTQITGNLNIAAATFAGSTFNFSLRGNWTNSSTFDPGTGTVTFNGTSGTQTLTGNTPFFNLTLNNPGATTNFGSTTTTIGNDLVTTAGTMDGSSSTIIFTGVTDNLGSISGAAAKNFFNLQVNSPATISNTTGGNTTIENNYVNDGAFTQAAALTTIFDVDNSADGAHTLSGAGTSTFGGFTINNLNTLDAGSHNFNVVGASFTATGTFTGNTSTVTFNGAAAQAIGGTGTKNFAGLTINNASGVSITDTASAVDASVSGLLTLTTDLTVAPSGILQQSGTSTGAADVIGTVRRTDLAVGVEKSFGNLNNSILFNSATAVPTQMDFNLVKSAPGAPFPATVKVVPRTYTLTPTGGTGMSATLKLRYTDAELVGPAITESRLILWKNLAPPWTPQAGSTVDAVNNFVSLSGVSSFSQWAIAEGSDLTLSKANNVSNAAVTGQPWNWTVTATNVGAPVTFTAGQTILVDNLPNSNINYGSPAVQNVSNITGSANILCTITSNDLTCTANGGSVTFDSNIGVSKFDVVFSATPLAVGSFANPRGGGGVAQIDPNGVIVESAEGNNTAANTVNVTAAGTTTTITSDNPDSSLPGQSVTVNFTVTANAPGAGSPTGTVTITVNDASGDTCNGPVTAGAGTCNLVLTTSGSKILTATYSGDANFNGSSDTENHDVIASNISAHDAKVAEPASGTANMLFTVTLSTPAPAAGVTVHYATADQAPAAGHAVAGTCGGGGDYVAIPDTVLSFAAGEQFKTVAATVCADADNSEPDETFVLNLSNATNGVIVTNQVVGTITTNSPGTFLISELRTRGSAGAGDDFVELYNNTNAPLTVAASDASAGYGVYKMGADCNASPVLIGTVPNGTVIPARGHYLVVGSAYSLANYGGTGAAAGNLTMSSDIEDDHNVAVFSTANLLNISSTNRLDAAGFGTNTGGVCDLLREGNNLGAVGAMNIDYTFFRSLIVGGNPKDTNDNASDFLFADTMGTPVAGVGQRLGAPGPENLASPIRRDNSGILLPLLDGTVTSSVAPNRFRDATPAGGNAPQGTLEIRRRVQNTTGATVTRLRFRIVDMTTGGPTPPAGTADLRLITSSPVVISGITDPATCASTGTPATTPCQVTVQTTTLETPPAQAAGGGYNSTVSVSIPGGLANNASIDVNFRLGVMQLGTFRFKLIIEALP